ncbi:MAG TPA: kelch repeat-containing protein [Nocardioides sp.]|nr:kelch repeat-containing protein [Nocardioides sp.]
MRRWIAAAAMVLGLVACSDDPADPPSGPPAADDRLSLSQPRAAHRATLLDDGRVLITGGCTEPGCEGFDAGRTSELFDPYAGLKAGPVMGTARASGTATLLADGRVLLAGGYPGEGDPPTRAAEIFDPASGSFAPTGDLVVARADHSASLLADGRVLLAGGFDASGRAVASTEVFDPASGEFTTGPDLSAPRAAHVAARVGERVVVVGGTEESDALATTEVFEGGGWRRGPSLLTPRVKLGVAPIGDGRVWVVGGATESEGREKLASTEVLDVRNMSSTAGPFLPQGEYKLDGAVSLLDDGRVVVPSGDALAVFDPASGKLRELAVTTYPAGSFRTVTPLTDRRVLVAGGYDDDIRPTAEAVVVTIPERAPSA